MGALAPSLAPTRADEAWRYADLAAVGALGPGNHLSWSELEVAPGETFVRSVLLSAGRTEVQRLRIAVGEGARCEIFAVNAAGAYARLEIEVRLEAGAHFEFGGVLIGGGEVVREFVTRTIHAGPGASSNQIVRAVHWGRATGNFLGRIDVARAGQKADAAQEFKGLLLERGASANARPELEIFADDVKCAHGATIGQIDEMARFYMASRGICPDVVDRLLIRAFIADAMVANANGSEQERLLGAALQALEDAR